MRIIRFLPIGFLAISVILNFFQARRILKMEALITADHGPDLAVGLTLPALEVKDLKGRTAILQVQASKAGTSTVIYVFSPVCPWCRSNAAAVDELSRQLNPARYRFIAIALSDKGLERFLREHDLRFPVYINPTPASTAAYHLGPTPETILLSPEGKVRGVWVGAYTDAARSELETVLSVRFTANSRLPS